MSFFAQQLRSIIQWENPDPTVLYQRWTDSGDEIKNASKLIVGPGQGCVFVYEGRVEAVYTEEGLFELRTSNQPFFTTLSRFMQGFKSEHKVGIYFFRTAKTPESQVGHRIPDQIRRPQVQVPRRTARLRQLFHAHRGSACLLCAGGGWRQHVPGRAHPGAAQCALGSAADRFFRRGRLHVHPDRSQREEIATALSAKLAQEFTQLGFLLEDFRIQGTSFDADTMRRIGRIADVNAEAQAASAAGVSYAQLQQLEALREAAKNQGSGGAGMAMAVGMGMAGAVGPALASQPGAQPDDPEAKLKKLKALLDQQLITQAEYDAKKKEVLSAF
jgi:membrane protease subunit (stomatin/prohibitin family)